MEKRLEQIAKMQNLSQNKQGQITKMQNQSRDELEQIAKMRRIKIMSKYVKRRVTLLKSKSSLAELLNNNADNGKISEIKKILNKLRNIRVLPKTIGKKLKKTLRNRK